MHFPIHEIKGFLARKKKLSFPMPARREKYGVISFSYNCSWKFYNYKSVRSTLRGYKETILRKNILD